MGLPVTQRFRSAFAAAISALALLAASAHASLVAQGTYFTDTSTGLDWLNNTPLAGQSYNSVLNGFGGYTASGWRYATAGELEQLVRSYVGPYATLSATNGYTAYTYGTGAYEAAYRLIELLGINVSFGNPPDPRATRSLFNADLTGIATQGWYDDGGGSANVGVFDFAAYIEPLRSPSPFMMVQLVPDFMSPDDFHGSNVSAILVRETHGTVPEPAGGWLLALGLFLVAVQRGLRRPG